MTVLNEYHTCSFEAQALRDYYKATTFVILLRKHAPKFDSFPTTCLEKTGVDVKHISKSRHAYEEEP